MRPLLPPLSQDVYKRQQLSQSFTRFYSDGSDVFWTHKQIQKLINIFRVELTAVSYTHLDVYKRQGIHHVMARTIKDIFCRYKTMKGYQVKRKAGWDTHGLPVELSVEMCIRDR